MSNKSNYAYIDSQNLNQTIQNLGWNVDWAKFRDFLHQEYNVEVAYLFIGYIPENQELYAFLQKAGFVLVFKPVVIGKDGSVKGNIDAELVLQVMIDQALYSKAVVVTGDGDFHGLVNYLYQQNRLEMLLVPNQRQFSQLLKGAAREKLGYISTMRRQLEYKRRNHTRPSGGGDTESKLIDAVEAAATDKPEPTKEPDKA